MNLKNFQDFALRGLLFLYKPTLKDGPIHIVLQNLNSLSQLSYFPEAENIRSRCNTNPPKPLLFAKKIISFL